VRDRDELVELLAEAVLGEVRMPRGREDWRADALALCSALARAVSRRRDAALILLDVPEALTRSQVHARLRGVLESTGLPGAEAREAATMMLAHVLVAGAPGLADGASGGGKPTAVSIDTGSRGVTLRAGASMSALIRVAHDPAAAAPAIVRGDAVIVRRRRGVGQGELELNPEQQWRFRVQAPTWNTVLNLPGLDVREIHIDSGAVRVECILPPPRGVVPIHVSSGVVQVTLRRPPGVKVVADISTGALQLRLDDFYVGATRSDVHWESAGPASADFYQLRISSGVVRLSLEEDRSIQLPDHAMAASPAGGRVNAALELVLDGIAARTAKH
jgi:hypothetical protein